MKKILAAAVAVSLVSGVCFAKPKAKGNEGYTKKDLVWTEDFNGSSLDRSKWNVEILPAGAFNQELQAYTDSPETVWVRNGLLHIQAIKTINEDGSVSYKSGRINTKGKVFYKYGRVEARIKMPTGQGYLPAFWMMPEDDSVYGIWPKCGEIDVVELLGQEPNTAYGTIHWGEPHRLNLNKYTLPSGDFSSDFHEFAAEWEPGVIRLYVDGNLYGTVNDWFSKRMGYGEVAFPAPYDIPFYFIFNVAVGGEWPGNPDEDTAFDERGQMQVDWIKFYQKKSYNEDVPQPVRNKIAIKTDSTGNLVDNEAWAFLAVSNGEGEFKNRESLDVSMTNCGDLEYSIQLCQWNMAMEQGKVYKYSFDAWADAPRSIITTISQPDHNYVRILPDTKEQLTTEKKHFEYVINFVELDDPHARIDFNLGAQGSNATVHIDNVRLEQIGDVDYLAITPAAHPDGNYVHNAGFTEGENRLGSWKVELPAKKKKASVSVTNDNLVREMVVVAPGGKISPASMAVYQDDIRLSNNEYIIEFDACANKKCKILVQLPGFNKMVTINAGKTMSHYKYRFVSDATGDYSKLLFGFGGAGAKIRMDNISIRDAVSFDNKASH